MNIKCQCGEKTECKWEKPVLFCPFCGVSFKDQGKDIVTIVAACKEADLVYGEWFENSIRFSLVFSVIFVLYFSDYSTSGLLMLGEVFSIFVPLTFLSNRIIFRKLTRRFPDCTGYYS